jgi:pimeloyl-ACP methyl ester carboxylesterase
MLPDVNGVGPTAINRRWSLPRGRIVLRTLRGDPLQQYLVFVPRTGAAEAPVLVSVHGISRNAHDQARVFASTCDERGVVLLVPIFTPERHRDYQRLGRRGRGERTDLVLNECLAEVALLTGAATAQIGLFGFSGGAQFAHRYLMAHPERVARAVFAAAGWYTFPDDQQRFPYGIRPARSLRGVTFNPEKFLRVPIEVLIGERDVDMTNLRRTERTNRQQGQTRLERARNWVAAMRAASNVFGIGSQIELTVVPDVDHSFDRFCRDGALVDRVFTSLFPAERESHTDDTASTFAGPFIVPAPVVLDVAREAPHGQFG